MRLIKIYGVSAGVSYAVALVTVLLVRVLIPSTAKAWLLTPVLFYARLDSANSFPAPLYVIGVLVLGICGAIAVFALAAYLGRVGAAALGVALGGAASNVSTIVAFGTVTDFIGLRPLAVISEQLESGHFHIYSPGDLFIRVGYAGVALALGGALLKRRLRGRSELGSVPRKG